MIRNFIALGILAASSLVANADELQSMALTNADEAKKVTQAVEAAVQDSVAWTFPSSIGLNFGQTAYHDWAEGGDNSVSLSGFANLNANYKKNKLMWNNNLYGEYGLIHSASYEDYTTRKNLDKLTFTSKFGYKAVKSWYYSALVDFKTQFYKGFDYSKDDSTGSIVRTKTSNFMAPATLITSLGMDYVPNKYLSLFLSPATGRFTFCRDSSLVAKCGLDEGDTYKAEFGAFVRVLNDFDIVKNIHLASKLELFSAYESFGNVVVNWDVLLTMKVTKYINASIRGQLKYDDAVPYIDPEEPDVKHGARVQLMDAITVGFAYSF